jgi:hypothetical protein
VESLQVQLQEQEEASKSAIDQWQEACVSAEGRCAALETELGCLKQFQPLPTADSPENEEASNDALRESLNQKERDLEAALQAIDSNDSTIRDLQGV